MTGSGVQVAGEQTAKTLVQCMHLIAQLYQFERNLRWLTNNHKPVRHGNHPGPMKQRNGHVWQRRGDGYGGVPWVGSAVADVIGSRPRRRQDHVGGL
ncbi:hypothetical protein, partial [Hoeflea sp.]|uniref:hypothetical protein n=1 Tax=Hoeflea sp. TaxID=1940281 RepID=UPI002AFDCF54